MPVERISQKQFHVRRRDRRMVWVDALAFLVGLLVVTASVGGVILYEREVEPIEWSAAFMENRLNETRACIGYEGGDQAGQGCTFPINAERGAYEGEEIEEVWPEVTQANVTDVTFRLNWLVDLPDPEEDCEVEPNCNRSYHYDENSTAVLRLQVFTPWGEVIEEVDANSHENVTDGTLEGVPSGSIRMTISVLDIPEDVPTFSAFTQDEAEAHFDENYRVDDHDGIGEWRTVVTVLRTSQMNGTIPTNPCQTAGLSQEDVPDGEENCDLYEEYNLVMGPGQGGAQGGLPTDYPGVYGIYGESAFDPVRGTINEQYGSSYKSEHQSWTLSMTVRGYEVMAGV